MTVSVVTSGVGANATDTTTFTAPTAGHMILLQARKNSAGASPPTVPTGYEPIGTAKEPDPATGATSVVHCYKISDGTETSATFGNMISGSRRITYAILSKSLDSWNIQHLEEWDATTLAPAIGPVTPDYANGFALGGVIYNSSLTDTKTVSAPFSPWIGDNFTGVVGAYEYSGLATDIEYEVTWPTTTKNCAIALVIVSDFASGSSHERTVGITSGALVTV